MSAKVIARTALIAALYVALSLLLQPVSYGFVQFRLAEALTILPVLMIEGIGGVALGCFIVNIFSPFALYDMIFGTFITLVSAILTRFLKKRPYIAALPPVILNAFFLPLIWLLIGADAGYWLNVLSIFISQTVIIYGVGLPLCYGLKKKARLY